MQELLINGTVHTGNEVISNAGVLVEDGNIVSLYAEQKEGMKVTDLQGKQLAPGFIDIQLNGGGQYYFSQDTSEAACRICTRAANGMALRIYCLASFHLPGKRYWKQLKWYAASGKKIRECRVCTSKGRSSTP